MSNPVQSNYQWIMGVYLLQGLPFALVTGVSPILYKTFGFTNSQIAFYSSLFILPWIFKFLLAPALEKLASKRTLILATQLSMVGLTVVLSCNLYFFQLFYLNNLIFFLIAIAGAIHDINSDGLYLESLNYSTQARLIGLRTVFYQLGKLICQGGLIILVGVLASKIGDTSAWAFMILTLAIFIFCITLYDFQKLPIGLKVNNIYFSDLWHGTMNSYRELMTELRQLPHLWSAVIFLLLYAWPEAQLAKIFPLFLLDSKSLGGLNLNVEYVGIIQGGFGILSMLLGVTISGYLLAEFTLKKCLIPFTVLLMLSHISYIFLSLYSIQSTFLISVGVIVAQIVFGLCNGAYMLYLINLFSRGPYAMSLYAIGTAIMLLGIMFAGATSGYLQNLLGYTDFFIWIVCGCIGLICLAIYNVRAVL